MVDYSAGSYGSRPDIRESFAKFKDLLTSSAAISVVAIAGTLAAVGVFGDKTPLADETPSDCANPTGIVLVERLAGNLLPGTEFDKRKTPVQMKMCGFPLNNG